jgi:transmembrane sensor
MVATSETGPFRSEAHEWVARLTSGHATAADAEAAKRWCSLSPDHAKAFAEATLLWETLEPVARRVVASDRQAVRDKPETKLPPRQARIGRRAFVGGALAASAAGAVYLVARPPPGFSELLADYRTGAGEQRSVTIDDIAVELNTKSSLNVLPANGALRRLELVSGEAVFATRGMGTAPLVLVAAGGEIRATDGKFDVRCDSPTASVVCLQGAVEVEYGNQVTVVQERQQFVYGADRPAPPTSVDPEVTTAWRKGWLIFHGAPLSDVIDEVNRYRSSRIILMNQSLRGRPVNATLPINRLDEVMTLLREAYDVKVTRLPGGIVILT